MSRLRAGIAAAFVLAACADDADRVSQQRPPVETTASASSEVAEAITVRDALQPELSEVSAAIDHAMPCRTGQTCDSAVVGSMASACKRLAAKVDALRARSLPPEVSDLLDASAEILGQFQDVAKSPGGDLAEAIANVEAIVVNWLSVDAAL